MDGTANILSSGNGNTFYAYLVNGWISEDILLRVHQCARQNTKYTENLYDDSIIHPNFTSVTTLLS